MADVELRQQRHSLRQVAWQKSSFSSNGSDCVEVAHDLAAVRDSKNPEGPTLRVDLRRFVSVIRAGQLYR